MGAQESEQSFDLLGSHLSDVVDLTGKVALVTGGGTGIGAASARRLAAHGADVAIAARTEADLERTAATIAPGRRCLVVPTDVKDEAQVVRMVQRTVAELGRVDILVNNAGGTRLGPLAALPTKAWDASFDLNVRAAYLATREVGVHFLAQRSGVIVNISSNAGVNGTTGGAHYSAAKAALQMFTRVTAAEWAPFGIRANCLAVGLVESERAVAAWKAAGLDPDALARDVPLGRVGRPDDISAAVVFFASDASSFITGQTLSIDGGPRLAGLDAG